MAYLLGALTGLALCGICGWNGYVYLFDQGRAWRWQGGTDDSLPDADWRRGTRIRGAVFIGLSVFFALMAVAFTVVGIGG